MSDLCAYVRVSTQGQADDGQGLDVQRDAIEAWARAHGHTIVATFEDAGISGSNGLEQRVGLADAMQAVRDHDGLVVARLDRLARDLVLQETLLGELARVGVAVFSTVPGEQAVLGDDPDDPSRQLIRQIMGAIGQYERSLIALRLRAGRDRKRALGGYSGGAPGFGWRAHDGDLEPVPGEQDVIETIRRLRGDGRSYAGVADELNARGLEARHGGRWHAATVRRVTLRPREVRT
jgi:DNA invertase Pin-like site-specific DNA recombinase